MKFACNKEIIFKEISNASDFTAQKTTSTAIYANVCLLLSGNDLTIKATDTSVGYISEITVDGIEDGVTTVICSKFLDILRNLPDETIQFDEKNDRIRISVPDDSIDFKLKTMNASGFPSVEKPDDGLFFEIPQKDFTDMINQVSFAVSDDESKFSMNGAFIEKNGSSLILVATDGKRLSYICRQTSREIPDFQGSTIPTRFLNIIKKLSINEGLFDVYIGPVSMFIRFGSCTIISNLIKNEFPAYRRVIPENLKHSITVGIKDLENALRRVSLLVENKYKKVIIEVSGNTMILNSENNDVGDSKIEIPCEYDGEDSVKCAMNYIYMMNPLKYMDGEKVKLSFNDCNKPFVMTPAEERDYLHVIMPMNVN